MENAFKEFKSLSEKNNFPIVIINLIGFGDKKKFNIHQRHDPVPFENIKKIAQENNFYFFDIYPAFESYSPKEFRLNVFDAHTNEKGHKLEAKMIYNFLITKKLIPDAENMSI